MRLHLLLCSVGLWALSQLPAVAMSSEDATRAITAAYEDILGRKPDEEGMRTYRSKMVEHGWSEKDVRSALRKSKENRIGDVDAIIKTAYQDILGRKPDEEGLATYRKKMQHDGWSEKDVRAALRKSKEAKHKD